MVVLGDHQAALYRAEACLEGQGRRWERIEEVRRYLDALVGSEWFGERWPWLVWCGAERRGSGAVWSTLHALDGAGPGGAPTRGVVLLAGSPLEQRVVLHELAHLLLPPEAGHGPGFAVILLTLVRAEMGFFAYAELAAALAGSPAFAGDALVTL